MTKLAFAKVLVLLAFVIVMSKYLVTAVIREMTSRTPYHVVVNYPRSSYSYSAGAEQYHLLGQYLTSTVSCTRKQHWSVVGKTVEVRNLVLWTVRVLVLFGSTGSGLALSFDTESRLARWWTKNGKKWDSKIFQLVADTRCGCRHAKPSGTT